MHGFGYVQADGLRDDTAPPDAAAAAPPPAPSLAGVPIVNLRLSVAPGFRRHDLELQLRLAALDPLLAGGLLQELFQSAIARQHERLLEQVAFAGDPLVAGSGRSDGDEQDDTRDDAQGDTLFPLLARRLRELEAVLACLDGTPAPEAAEGWHGSQVSQALALHAEHDLAVLAAWPSPPVLDSVVGRAAQAMGNAVLVPAGEAAMLLDEAVLLLGGAVDAVPDDAYARVLLGWLLEHHLRDDAAAATHYAAAAASPDAALALVAGRALAELQARNGALPQALAAATAAVGDGRAGPLLTAEATFLVARLQARHGEGEAAAAQLAPLLARAREAWHLAVLAEPDFNACLPVQRLLAASTSELAALTTPAVVPEVLVDAPVDEGPPVEAVALPTAAYAVATPDFSGAEVETVDYSLPARRTAAARAAVAWGAVPPVAATDDAAIAASWFGTLVEPPLARLAVAACGVSTLFAAARVALATPQWDAFAVAGWLVCTGMGVMAWCVLRVAHARLVSASRTWAEQSLAEQARERFSAAMARRQSVGTEAAEGKPVPAPDAEVTAKSRHWFASLAVGAAGASLALLAGPGLSGEAWASWPWWGVALPLVLLATRMWGERWTH